MPDAHQKVPKRIDLTGCSFQGKPLSAQELEERERRSEFMEEHRKEIDNNVLTLRSKHQKATGTVEETKKVSRRARHFAKGEIRKEYGIMQKPYDTKIENILWCIVNKGPIDLKGIAEIMGYKDHGVATRSLSSPLSSLHACLGEKEPYGLNWIGREFDGGRNFYKVKGDGLNKSVEVLYENYRKVHSQAIKERKKKQKQDEENIVMSHFKKRKVLKVKDADPIDDGKKIAESMAKNITEIISDTVSKTLGVKVEVTGAIKILFGFTRDK